MVPDKPDSLRETPAAADRVGRPNPGDRDGSPAAADGVGRPTMADLRATLRAHGLRVTPQRLAVHGALRGLGRHSTAEEVLERVHGTVPGVSLPTVYATLELLADLGLAARVHAGRAVRYDPRADPHHHLVCSSCGAVFDLDAEVELGPALAHARALGAAADAAEVTVRGRCAACLS